MDHHSDGIHSCKPFPFSPLCQRSDTSSLLVGQTQQLNQCELSLCLHASKPLLCRSFRATTISKQDANESPQEKSRTSFRFQGRWQMSAMVSCGVKLAKPQTKTIPNQRSRSLIDCNLSGLVLACIYAKFCDKMLVYNVKLFQDIQNWLLQIFFCEISVFPSLKNSWKSFRRNFQGLLPKLQKMQ